MQLLRQMQEEGAPENKPFAAMLQYDESYRQRSRSYLKRLPVNRGIQWLRNTALYSVDMLRRLLPTRGFAITFSGIDGAGRNTVIDATRRRIVQELRMPVVVLPHRPSLLPMLMPSRFGHERRGAGNAIPLSQAIENPSLFGGLLRFVYYYIDYLIGQCYVYLRYVMRGYVVLYDHYFDLFSDSKSNVVLPAAYTSWWYRFLLKPDLNFLLYAPTNVVMERRQELTAQDIDQLTGQYLALFQKLEQSSGSAHFISVRNMRLGDTMETLFHYIKERQAEAAA
jgi:thymidylate kinase